MRMADNDELDNAMYRASMKAMNGSVIGTTIGMAGYFGLNKFCMSLRLPFALSAAILTLCVSSLVPQASHASQGV